jgi:nucleoid DNA-binding protein
MTATTTKPMSKKDVHLTLADKTGLTKKEIAAVLDALAELIVQELGEGGHGAFQLLGLVKLKVARRPATKARQGTNPFSGQRMTIKAKPARQVIKATPLKPLRDLVQ